MLQELVKTCGNCPESLICSRFCSDAPDLLTFSIQMVVTVVEMLEVKVEMEEDDCSGCLGGLK